MKIFFSIILSLCLFQNAIAGSPISGGGGNLSGGGGNLSGGGGNLSGGEGLSSGGGLPFNSYHDFHRHLIGANLLLNRGYTGKNQTILIADSGISKESVAIDKLIFFRDYIGNCTLENPCDENSHGTSIADLIHQIAPDANIIAFRILDKEAQGNSDHLIDTLNWARKNKEKYNITVINLSLDSGPSLSSGYNDADSLRDEVQKVIDAGIHVVVGSGNSSKDVIEPFTAANPNALSVGSFNHSFSYEPQLYSRSAFANFGILSVPQVEHFKIPFIYESTHKEPGKMHVKPDIFAPGDHILVQILPQTFIYNKNYWLQKIHDTGNFNEALKYAQSYFSLLISHEKDPVKKIFMQTEQQINFRELTNLDKIKKYFCGDYLYFLIEKDKKYYAFVSGTSYSTAFVSAGIALLKDAMPEAAPKQLRDVLIDQGDAMVTDDSRFPTEKYNSQYLKKLNADPRKINRINLNKVFMQLKID